MKPAIADERPKLYARGCRRCQFPNMMDSIFCSKCASPLGADLAVKMVF